MDSSLKKTLTSCLRVLSTVFLLSCTIFEPAIELDEDSIAHYLPRQPMIKVFEGGFENEGMIHVIDKIRGGRFQIKQVDFGTAAALVYHFDANEVRWIYSDEIIIFEESYLDYSPNRNNLILQGPVKTGSSWEDETGAHYEITGVDVVVNTPAGNFKALEVTFQRGEFEMKQYYVRNIGIVKTDAGYFGSQLKRIEYDLSVINEVESFFELLILYLR